LKPASGSARAEVTPTEFLREFPFAVNDLLAAFDAGFGRISLSTFTAALERRLGLGRAGLAWHTS
jgi:hypothetical protein